jgi:hypothetical protein
MGQLDDLRRGVEQTRDQLGQRRTDAHQIVLEQVADHQQTGVADPDVRVVDPGRKNGNMMRISQELGSKTLILARTRPLGLARKVYGWVSELWPFKKLQFKQLYVKADLGLNRIEKGQK